MHLSRAEGLYYLKYKEKRFKYDPCPPLLPPPLKKIKDLKLSWYNHLKS
jgi:hypothetical protein